MGIQNLWVLKIYLYSKFVGLQFVGTQKSRVLKFVGIDTQKFLKLKFLDTLICGYTKWWVLKICNDTKFQVSGREYQNIRVLYISCE